MLTSQEQLEVVAILFVLVVAIVDCRTHRIPNLLCATAAIVAVFSQLWLHGEDGLLNALGGAAVGFAMFLPFYALRAFGAGDVKAMAVVGTFLGANTAILAAGMTLIAGALLGVAVLLLRPVGASATWARLMGLFLAPVASMRASRRATNPESRQRFPYGVAIACGTASALLLFNH